MSNRHDPRTSRPAPTFHTERPFAWGVLVLLDRDAREVPELGDAVVASSAHGLVVRVRHAQDVDLEGSSSDEAVPRATVRVAVTVGAAPRTGTIFRGEIDVPSGFLTIGDADREDLVQLGAGRWSVHVGADPRDAAEDVHVWFTPASAHSSVSSPR